jgi:hypothetical protein
MKDQKLSFIRTIEGHPNFQRGVICVVRKNATCDGHQVDGKPGSPKAK